MKRMPFEPPTEYYDERIETIDEKICDLIEQRKDLSNNNPGFPNKKLINAWAKRYNLFEDFLNRLFVHFLNEENFRPVIEPKGFLKNIPILKSFEKDDRFYSVTFVRQFENASVVHFTIDRDASDEMPGGLREHTFFELSIAGTGEDYDCRNEGGGGSNGHTSFTFIVSPSLPDDISEIVFVFKEYKASFKAKPTGVEFFIKVEN
ncbi:hypothetical protein [Halobacillus naozhouensis]|uniref:Chorismate mutase n=1 Tax=Halobacillus naozhouensis TaxID=554880 RepID=A0ABY8J1Z3_9BACI|nr:hypothetical protein [Halobacillus naozhouensis]WFT76517.1 hypothetical protein P9989_09205 [Halobacillus naozhouensis]